MKNIFKTIRKAPVKLLIMTAVFFSLISCNESKKSGGSEKFLGKWKCSTCPYKILTIEKYGDNFTIDMDGGGVVNASYNKEFNKLVCPQLNQPDILYNSETDKIRAIGNEYTHLTHGKISCASVKEGSFETDKYIIERQGNKQIMIEKSSNKKIEQIVEWVSDCEYHLIQNSDRIKMTIINVDNKGYDCIDNHSNEYRVNKLN